jgi:hypothetical protein
MFALSLRLFLLSGIEEVTRSFQRFPEDIESDT